MPSLQYLITEAFRLEIACSSYSFKLLDATPRVWARINSAPAKEREEFQISGTCPLTLAFNDLALRQNFDHPVGFIGSLQSYILSDATYQLPLLKTRIFDDEDPINVRVASEVFPIYIGALITANGFERVTAWFKSAIFPLVRASEAYTIYSRCLYGNSPSGKLMRKQKNAGVMRATQAMKLLKKMEVAEAKRTARWSGEALKTYRGGNGVLFAAVKFVKREYTAFRRVMFRNRYSKRSIDLEKVDTRVRYTAHIPLPARRKKSLASRYAPSRGTASDPITDANL